jgi:cysteine desulfurase/selenocysteine lyase
MMHLKQYDWQPALKKVHELRKHFPLLHTEMNGKPLVYLDNAATTQKPNAVIEACDDYYRKYNSNVHRGIHRLSADATIAYEAVRDKVRRFLNANTIRECIFVRGATEGINLVAQSFVAPRILPGEGILLTQMEHHSNIVPWQMVCKKTGAGLWVTPIHSNGELDLNSYEEILATKNIKFVAVTYASNTLGTVNPIKKMIDLAHHYGALVLVDGCDFYVFSGHKIFAPTGSGVIWGKEHLLDESAPYQGGGEMIQRVTFELTDYAPLPHKFEAGTPDIAAVIGLGAAIDFLFSLDVHMLIEYEAQLLKYATEKLSHIKGINIMGNAANKIPVISWVHGTIHAHDIGTLLDSEGIAVRSGHHCTMPLLEAMGVSATTRASFCCYNTPEEVDKLVKVLATVEQVFA